MTHWLIVLIQLFLWFGVAYWLQLVLLKDIVKDWIEAMIWTVIIAFVAIPLIMIRLHFDLGMNLGIGNIRIVLAVFGVGLGLWIRQRRFDLPRSKSVVLGWILLGLSLLVGYLMIGRKVLVFDLPVVGPDSYAYVRGASRLENSGSLMHGFDRSMVYMLISLIGWLGNISMETAVKFFMFGLYCLNALVMFLLAREKLGKSFGIVAMLLSLICWGVLRLGLDMMAMFTGQMIVLLIFWLLARVDKSVAKIKWRCLLILGILWGSLFQSHGIVAFSSVVFLGAALFVREWKTGVKIKKTKFLSKWLVLFLMVFWTGIPLSYKGWIQMSRILIREQQVKIERTAYLEKQSEEKEFIKSPTQPEVENYDLNSNKKIDFSLPKWKEFPRYKDRWLETYHWSWLILAGLGILSWSLKQDKTDPWWWGWIAFTGAEFLFSQQEYLGINWYAGRFVFLAYGWIIMWMVYGLKIVWKSITRERRGFWLKLGLLFLLLAPTILSSAQGVEGAYQAVVNQDEYEFYLRIKNVIGSNDEVLSTNRYFHWQEALLQKVKQKLISEDAMCGNEQWKENYPLWNWNMGQSFGQSGSTDEVLKLLVEEEKKVDNLFIVLDKRSQCLNMDLFDNSKFELIDKSNDLEMKRLIR